MRPVERQYRDMHRRAAPSRQPHQETSQEPGSERRTGPMPPDRVNTGAGGDSARLQIETVSRNDDIGISALQTAAVAWDVCEMNRQ
jgi:hypothetical protein